MLRQFVQQLRTAKSVDFPRCAVIVGLSYHSDIKPAFALSWFRTEIDKVLEEFRFHLVNLAMDAAMHGKSDGTPDLAYIREVIKIIDSNVLIPGSKTDGSGGAVDISEHLARLGLEPDESEPTLK